MLLAIDIGNSQIVCGVFQDSTLISHWRLSTDNSKTPDEYSIIFRSLLQFHKILPEDILGCIVTSVVPPLTHIFDMLAQSLFGQSPLIVTSACPHGLILQYNNPEEIGTDRLVNAAAAFARYKRYLIIVDFGTATTFCIVTQQAEYLGGTIAPGLKSAADTLHTKTAKLPKVDLVIPASVIGKDTTSSMQAGIMYGYAGLVDEIVRRIQQEIGESPLVIATGGLAQTIVPISHTIQEVRPNLTLEGLKLLYDRMNPSCG
ncbi:type III pantothenate kinase [Candidatus Nitrospira allomarina]|jgi:type III pantothenate kinase|uniref:Type III pantothenate kinase n=1 Tax=Candidatus Nitrospira allomarina TaxID=3020900 RepID=A0AA96G894_9BACT|nr:type III pantothenate kinase [Candidatus Nitrospira allomarina]WNM56993.1 type III pantothenate kinase [Candidatus Nitrospira allomarina]